MESKQVTRKGQYKDIFSSNFEQRKKSVSTASADARKKLIESLRQSADMPSTSSGDLKNRRIFSRLFMQPDAMVEIPSDLADNWCVMLRPEGARCILIIKHNSVTVRSKNGVVTEEFVMDPFALDPRETKELVILDAVSGINERTMKREYFVTDVILMNNNELVFSDFEFRQFYLKQHWPFNDSGYAPLLGIEEDTSSPAFSRIESVPATRENITRLYHGDPGYGTDSLVFHHRGSKYESGLATDCALYFRDAHLSRYNIDTQYMDGFEGDENQAIVMKISRKNKLFEFRTWDGVSVKQVEEVPVWVSGKLVKKDSSVLAKVEINGALEFVSISPSRKPFPFSYNRIVEQFRKRKAQLKWPNLGLSVLDAPPLTIDSFSVV
jgi:snurportin-1